MKTQFWLAVIVLFSACSSEADKVTPFYSSPIPIRGVEVREPDGPIRLPFKTYFSVDTTLEKPTIPFAKLRVTNGVTADTLLLANSCQKNTKDNSIKIQAQVMIPTRRELDSLPSNAPERYTKLQGMYHFGSLPKKHTGQLKVLNIHLKDRMVQEINLLSRSSDPDYDGTDFKKERIDRYQIKISRFDYKVASDVYGEFALIVPDSFGFIENDTLISGSFLCMNWIVNSEETIQKWNFIK